MSGLRLDRRAVSPASARSCWWSRVSDGAAHADACAVLQVSVLQMHGTGTALGDPIEMNAALTALVGPGSKAPLQFSAHKASCGHAEPSAGTNSLVLYLLL